LADDARLRSSSMKRGTPVPNSVKDIAGRVACRVAPFAGTVVAIDTTEPAVALSFDDGPTDDGTPGILECLERHGARATFFVLGPNAARRPQLIGRARAAGHEIALHGWEHRSLTLQAPNGFIARARWRRGQFSRSRSVAQGPVRLARAPYGHDDLGTRLAARSAGCKLVAWKLSADDWDGADGETLFERVRTELAPGAIVLFHDGLADAAQPEFADRTPTVRAVDRLLTELSSTYKFVTISELLALGKPRIRFTPRRGAAADLAGLTPTN
jgi:peptidoglycan/xylan/chitin deacetylase (PgdA/CDA1 family)